MRRFRISVAIPLALAFAANLGAGCSSDPNDGAGDAPIATVDRTGWTILNNVDGYPNVAFRCLGPNGIYTTRGDVTRQLEVIPNDPLCATQPR